MCVDLVPELLIWVVSQSSRSGSGAVGPNAGVPPRFVDENARESCGPPLPPPRLRAPEASAAHLVRAVPFSGSGDHFR